MKIRVILGLSILTFLGACNSNIDKELTYINSFYGMVSPTLKIETLPENADSALWAFALTNPKNSRSDTFAYRAIQIKLARNRALQAAQWADVYLETFKKNTNQRIDLYIMAAHHYELHQVYDRALDLYKKFILEFPDHEIAPQAKQMVEFIEKGLVTPEQQLEYLLNKKQPQS